MELYKGDCLEVMDELIKKGVRVDCVITDPPYEFISKNPTGGGFMKSENKKHLVDLEKSFGMSFNPKNFLNNMKRIMKKMNLYVFTNKSLLSEYINFAESNNYKWEILIWRKSNQVPIFNNHYMFDKEYCLFISEKGTYFNRSRNRFWKKFRT